MLLIDPVRMLPSLLVPLVGVLVVGGFSPRSYLWAAFGLVGTVVFALIRWATFTYEIVRRPGGDQALAHQPLDPHHPAGTGARRRRVHPAHAPPSRPGRPEDRHRRERG
ncbi:hypothetical protein ACFSTC_14705 [Nonomuraea ferruginea]